MSVQALYRAILAFYPAEYRAVFGPEMLRVFEEANINSRKRGFPGHLRFAIGECLGLLKGIIAEHVARRAVHDAYIASLCALQPTGGDAGKSRDMERRLEYLIRSMEFAIAHHDFPKARYYSNEERAVRAQLRLLAENE